MKQNTKTRRYMAALLPALAFAAVAAQAQTMQWAVRPINARLEDYGQMLKVRRNGKCGLMEKNGQEIVPAEYDSITPIYNGYSFLLTRRGNDMKIEGIMAEGAAEIISVADDVCATQFPWFSEGLMPVKQDAGYGYMDTKGNTAIPCVFEEAYPFSERWASVKMDGKAYYIDHNMDYMAVQPADGDIVFGSTFSGGEAVVYSYWGRGYVINTAGRKVANYKVKPDNVQINTYDYSVDNKAQTLGREKQKLPVDSRFGLFREGRLYGYKSGDRVVIPPQFDKADLVRGGYASVTLNGQNGILKVVEGDVAATIETSLLQVKAGKAAEGRASISLPQSMQDDVVRLRISDEQQGEYAVMADVAEGTHRTYIFSPAKAPKADVKSKCTMEVWSDNLLLKREYCALSYKVEDASNTAAEPVAVKPASLSLQSIEKKKKRANRFDVSFITVKVQNSGDTPGKARLTLFVNGKAVDRKNVVVQAGRRETVEFSVPNIKKRFLAKVKATFDGTNKSQEATIEFEPFY